MGVSAIETAFPKIRKQGYKITSIESADYNCFAWVIGNESQWWSPVTNDGYYWPKGAPKSLDLKTFAKLYEMNGGYSTCSNSNPEKGFEKIALYANASGQVTHAAKQTGSGKWTSKLGDWEDIEHATLEALEGDFYGTVVQILKSAVK
jgi:hypothetical protein